MRVVASQKLPRDSGESIFAARHQPTNFGLWKVFSDSGKWSFHTPTIHTPTRSRPSNGPSSLPDKQCAETPEIQGGKTASLHQLKLFGSDFPADVWPLRPNAGGVEKFLPVTRAARNRLLVRTSTIISADVHDTKGSQKLCAENYVLCCWP